MSEQSENIIPKAEVLQDTVLQESTSAIVQASTEPNVTEQPQEPTLNVAPTEGVVTTVEEAQPMPLPPPSSFEAAPAADNVNTPIPEGIVETPKASESPITANTTSEPVPLEKTISVEPLNKTKSKAALSKSKPKLPGKNGASKPSIIQAVETPIIETTAEFPKGEGETKLPNSNTDVQERIKKGIFPIFLTSITQELFKLKPNEQLTPEKPFRFVHRADIQSDMQTRAAISDFYPAKQLIMDFPQDEILVHHDPEFFYGQNFFLVVTQDALDAILNPIVAVPENQSENTKANVRSPWNCLGSDKEMEAESIILNREAVVVRASREYRGFNQLCKFGDRDALEGYTECRPFRDPNYEVTRLELPVSCQAVPHVHDSSIQTTWFRKLNMCIQYEPILMTEEEKTEVLESVEITEFLKNVLDRFEQSLLHNEMVDIFTDEYECLDEEETTTLGDDAHSNLQEYQSFTDLKHSKNKSISCVQWHPTIKGAIAVACVQRNTLDERIETGFNVGTKNSLLLIWGFQDPIHPQLVLEAPDDIQCFEFNPTDTNIIVGGCVNGQVVLWDISEYQDKLKANSKKDAKLIDDPLVQKKQVEQLIKWTAVSSIEGSHRGSIAHLLWLPLGIEINNTGEVTDLSKTHASHKQFITASLDGSSFVWDLRYKKDLKALDLVWKPFLRIPLSAMDNTFDYGLTRITIKGLYDKAVSSQINISKIIDPVNTKFYGGTEEGDVIVADWAAEQTTEEKGSSASRVEKSFSFHFGAISALTRSPFFPDIILSVGGWSFNIWKENVGVDVPLLCSPKTTAYVISGAWSTTRPGVFYISKADGTVEVWDLIDKSHIPTSVQNVSSMSITNIAIHQYQGKSKSIHQFLAVSDDDGTLHILEVPRNLSKPVKNEKVIIKAFFDREIRRLHYSKERNMHRKNEKNAFEQETMQLNTAAVGNAPAALVQLTAPSENSSPEAAGDSTAENVPKTIKEARESVFVVNEEEEEKLEQEFLKMERGFLISEGLLKEEMIMV